MFTPVIGLLSKSSQKPSNVSLVITNFFFSKIHSYAHHYSRMDSAVRYSAVPRRDYMQYSRRVCLSNIYYFFVKYKRQTSPHAILYNRCLWKDKISSVQPRKIYTCNNSNSLSPLGCDLHMAASRGACTCAEHGCLNKNLPINSQSLVAVS